MGFVKYALNLQLWLLELMPHSLSRFEGNGHGKLGVKNGNQLLGSIFHL